MAVLALPMKKIEVGWVAGVPALAPGSQFFLQQHEPLDESWSGGPRADRGLAVDQDAGHTGVSRLRQFTMLSTYNTYVCRQTTLRQKVHV